MHMMSLIVTSEAIVQRLQRKQERTRSAQGGKPERHSCPALSLARGPGHLRAHSLSLSLACSSSSAAGQMPRWQQGRQSRGQTGKCRARNSDSAMLVQTKAGDLVPGRMWGLTACCSVHTLPILQTRSSVQGALWKAPGTASDCVTPPHMVATRSAGRPEPRTVPAGRQGPAVCSASSYFCWLSGFSLCSKSKGKAEKSSKPRSRAALSNSDKT